MGMHPELSRDVIEVSSDDESMEDRERILGCLKSTRVSVSKAQHMNKKTYTGGHDELFVDTIVGMDYLREAIEILAESITQRDMDEPQTYHGSALHSFWFSQQSYTCRELQTPSSIERLVAMQNPPGRGQGPIAE
jgi:hypothetical protein